MIFPDRAEAGRKLGEALGPRRGALILGIPRGGVIVAREAAAIAGGELDVIIPRKLGAPTNPELGIGAVAADGTTALDERLVHALGVSEQYIAKEVARQVEEIHRRLAMYRRGRPPLDVSGRDCVVVDDGVATGGTAEVALANPAGYLLSHEVNDSFIGVNRLLAAKEDVYWLKNAAGAQFIPVKAGTEANVRKLAQEVAPRLGIRLQEAPVGAADELLPELAMIAKERPDALFVYPDVVLSSHPRPRQLADFALKAHLPTMHAFRFFVDAGGLMSYGATQSEIYTMAAEQVAKILAGARPSELPLRQATRFELVINNRTAKALGLTIPPSLLLRADEVIE